MTSTEVSGAVPVSETSKPAEEIKPAPEAKEEKKVAAKVSSSLAPVCADSL